MSVRRPYSFDPALDAAVSAQIRDGSFDPVLLLSERRYGAGDLPEPVGEGLQVRTGARGVVRAAQDRVRQIGVFFGLTHDDSPQLVVDTPSVGASTPVAGPVSPPATGGAKHWWRRFTTRGGA